MGIGGRVIPGRGIVTACPGYKLLDDKESITSVRCCELTRDDNECGKTFFLTGRHEKCVCEKKGHHCIRYRMAYSYRYTLE